jgi:hypothetical protein
MSDKYSEEDKQNAQHLRIILAIYKQGWEDAIHYLLTKKHQEFHNIDKTLEWLNEIPPPTK